MLPACAMAILVLSLIAGQRVGSGSVVRVPEVLLDQATPAERGHIRGCALANNIKLEITR